MPHRVSVESHFKRSVRQLDEFELVQVRGAIKGIAHDDLTQFRHDRDIAEHAVEQVQEPI